MPTFPAEFADLEPYSAWAIAGEGERYAMRLASTMAELQSFYDAVFPRLEAAASYLREVSIDGIGEEDKRLLWLFASLVTVSFPVEVWHQPKVPDSGSTAMVAVVEPAV
jgi:hypothetical protein